MPIYVPIHPELTMSIKACPSPGLAIIAKDDGTNYTKESLGNLFREAVEAAGIPVTRKGLKEKGSSAHGLRKASATIAAESGASEAELNAMFGWSGHQMAQLYTRKADRKKHFVLDHGIAADDRADLRSHRITIDRQLRAVQATGYSQSN